MTALHPPLIVDVETGTPYQVHIQRGLRHRLASLLPPLLKGEQLALLADAQVYQLYGEALRQELEGAGYRVPVFTFPPGEAHKTADTWLAMLHFLSQEGLDRGDALVALGGGITGDLAGFAAASYLRGIPFIQVPTTFLACVDSSVGGKTGLNLPRGKNLAGAFHQPAAVFCDTQTLESLPGQIYEEGVAEAIKTAVIGDPTLFDLLGEKDFSTEEVLRRCVSLKASIVAEDEKEAGLRMVLNLGHTPAHAIEAQSDYRIRHGRAVAMGLLMVTRGAEAAGYAEEGTAKALLALLEIHGLAEPCPYSLDQLAPYIKGDKKRRGQRLTLILPRRIGQVQAVDLPLDQALALLKSGWEAS